MPLPRSVKSLSATRQSAHTALTGSSKAKRTQSDKPLMLSIHYGMLRNKVCFSLDLSGITVVIRAGVSFYSTLKKEVLLRNKEHEKSGQEINCTLFLQDRTGPLMEQG